MDLIENLNMKSSKHPKYQQGYIFFPIRGQMGREKKSAFEKEGKKSRMKKEEKRKKGKGKSKGGKKGRKRGKKERKRGKKKEKEEKKKEKEEKKKERVG